MNIDAHYIGIDPGVTGGIGMINSAGELTMAIRMPATGQELVAWFHGVKQGLAVVSVMLEQVHSHPKQGHVGAFTFGEGFGYIRGVLDAIGIDFALVTPQRWQGYMECRTGGDKSITLRAAKSRWPAASHYTADALLIAEYARQTRIDRERRGR